MKKAFVFGALLTLFAGTAALVHNDRPETLPAQNAAILASSAAFRDGLYLGRLTAQRGGPIHIASGRWAKEADRSLFAAGFEEGYHQAQVGSSQLTLRKIQPVRASDRE